MQTRPSRRDHRRHPLRRIQSPRRRAILELLEKRHLLAAVPISEPFTNFLGTGLVPTPAAGELNSNDWKVSGLSDGDTNFGDSQTGGDYARGQSTGGVSSGGLYSFEVAPGDRALGVQPTGSDFTPGSLTFRVQNTTGLAQDMWSVDFDSYVLNNGDRANSLNVLYSTDDVTYTAIPSADLTTPEALDASATWSRQSRSLMINLTSPVADNGFFYLRWESDDVSGSGSRDEIAIDNLVVTSEDSGSAVPPDSSAVYLNEVLFDPPGPDDPPGAEYIELRGDSGSRIPADTYLVTIEGDPSSGFAQNVGKVANIFNLSGLEFGSNGFMVIGQQGGGYTIDAGSSSFISTAPGFGGLSFYSTDVTTLDQIENASNSLLLIQSTTPPSLSDDIDANNDGTADGSVWAGWNVLDGVSVLDIGDATEFAYADLVFARNGGGAQVSAPAGATVVDTGTSDVDYVARIGDSTGNTASDWLAGELSGTLPNWSLATGGTFPASQEGDALNHIGTNNPAGPVGPVADVVINEVRISHVSLDNVSNNFVELYETSGAGGVSLDGLSLVVLTGQTDTNSPPAFTAGDISFVFDLTGGTTDANGFTLIADNGTAASVDPGDVIVNNLDFFGSPQTFLVVSGFTGTQGDDLDPDDNGILDSTPWADVIDVVTLDDGDATVQAQNYASTDPAVAGITVQPTTPGFAPAAIARIPDGDANIVVLRGDDTFLDDSDDTPGATNQPGFELNESNGATGVVEGGADDTFTFVLTGEPSSDVTVTFASPDGETTITPTTLTFTPTAGAMPWNVAQTVTVSAVVDTDTEGTHQGVINVTTSSGDGTFDALAVPDINVVISEPVVPPNVVINELRISSATDDNLSNNFVEIFNIGGTQADLSGLTLVVISEDFSPGEINFAVSLDGLSTNADGFALIADDGAQPTSQLSDGILSLENFDLFGSPSTFLLVSEFTGVAGQDLDADNDGVLDVTPWSRIDAVTLEAGEFPSPGYDSTVVLTTETTNTVAAARRLVDGTGAFDVLPFESTARDTPGATNILPAGVTITDPNTPSIISENGLTDDIEFVLDAAPTGPVTVTVTPDGEMDLGSGPGTAVDLTFLPGDWFIPQTITVAAVDDAVDEGDHVGVLTTTVASGDTAYDGLVVAPTNVDIIDNDNSNHAVVINEILHDPANGDDVNNDGVANTSQDEFVEVLNTSANVVDLSGWTLSDSFGLRHTFAPGTFLAPGQAIVVFGGGTLGTYGNSLAATASTGSLGLSASDSVTLFDGVRIIDYFAWEAGFGVDLALARIPDGTGDFIEDVFGFTPGLRNEDGTPFVVGPAGIVTPTNVTVTEGGATGTFDVRLTGSPSANVMITLTPADAEIDLGGGVGNAVTLTFTPANAGDVQTVTVTADDDSDDEGLHASSIAVTSTSTDGSFSGLTLPTVNVSIVDNDGTAILPGDIVITEIMQNPSAVADALGEYFEIFNTTAAPIDINGWTISDADSDSHVINNGGPLNVAPGAYIVLGINSDMATNGGVPVDYQYTGVNLANGSDELILTDLTATEIDRVEWDDGATFPDPNGAAMELIPTLVGNLGALNDVGANWHVSSTTFGDGDLGTPGSANSSGVVAPAFVTVQINDGASAQRSMVTSITVEFTENVALGNAPFVLTNTTTNEVVDLSAATINVVDNLVTISFADGVSVDSRTSGNSLSDGNYRLDIVAAQIFAALDGGTEMASDVSFGTEAADLFFRLFGDMDGDRDVLGSDLQALSTAFGTVFGDANFNDALDFEGDGDVLGADLAEFSARFGSILDPPA